MPRADGQQKTNSITFPEIPCLTRPCEFYLILFTFFYFSFNPTGSLCTHYSVQSNTYTGLLNANKWISASVSISYDFSWTLSRWFVFSYSDVLGLLHLVLFYYYPLGACLFSNEIQKRVHMDRGKLGRNWEE